MARPLVARRCLQLRAATLRRGLRRGVVASLAMGALALPVAAQIDFAPARHYAAASRPSGGTALDYDLDGDLDLVVACRGDDELAFLENLGDATFAPPLVLPLASDSNPEGVTSGDFDHDGDVDLAVVLYGAEELQIVAANGDGTFTPGATFALGFEPSRVVASDLDGNGWLDLAINQRGDGDVAVLLSEAAGGFADAAFYDIGDETRDVAAGDLTGDGIPDLAVSSRDDRIVRVLENLGDGTFQALIDLSYGSQLEPHGIGLADFDRDGWLDLYSVSRGSVFEAPQVFLRWNGGNPWIGPINGAFKGVDTTGCCHGDFDLDGIVDMATCNALSNDVTVMRNAAIGIFNRGIEFPVGTNPECEDMLAADLDGDGDLDLVTFNEGGDDVSLLENNTRLCQEDLGFGGPGDARLTICGEPFATGNVADLVVTDAAPNRPAWIAASLTFAPTPFKGGQLVPIGLELFLPFATDATGSIVLDDLEGGGGPIDVYVQALILDPAQQKGVALTNALKLVVLP